jgi:hypothetical protein
MLCVVMSCNFKWFECGNLLIWEQCEDWILTFQHNSDFIVTFEMGQIYGWNAVAFCCFDYVEFKTWEQWTLFKFWEQRWNLRLFSFVCIILKVKQN